jgi:hypothetical protein
MRPMPSWPRSSVPLAECKTNYECASPAGMLAVVTHRKTDMPPGIFSTPVTRSCDRLSRGRGGSGVIADQMEPGELDV